MSTDTTYNGWTNYPTWCVHLWLGNDADTYQSAVTLVRETFAEYMSDMRKRYPASLDNDAAARSYAADALCDWVTDSNEDNDMTGRDMSQDLYTWALGQVNWHEIARAFLEDAA